MDLDPEDKLLKYKTDETTFMSFLQRVKHICLVLFNILDLESRTMVNIPDEVDGDDNIHVDGTIAYFPWHLVTFYAAFPLSFIDSASDEEIVEWRDELLDKGGQYDASNVEQTSQRT